MNIYYQNIVERMNKNLDQMTDTEQMIAKFFLENQKKKNFSAKVISKELHVSETSLSRFAKKIGFSGYREFQYMYEIYFQTPQSNNSDYVQHILDTYADLLHSFNGNIEMEQVEKVCEQMSKSSRVFIYALGSSACAAAEFKLRFMRLGLQVEVIDNPHLMQMHAVLTQPDDMVIGISLSGETAEVTSALVTAQMRSNRVTLITANRRKSLKEKIQMVLVIPSIDGLDLGDNISPQMPILVLTDVIYSAYMAVDSKYKSAIFQDTLAAIQKNNKEE